MSILIKNILLAGKKKDIYIEGNLIQEISGKIDVEADYLIDGKNKAALPGLINTHSHAAMALLRSYADDLKLHDWLQKHIWPLEAKLTPEDIYWGAKLACLEMIKIGTTCFSDMYWNSFSTARAVEEMGLRAVVSPSFLDLGDDEKWEKFLNEGKEAIKKMRELNCERIIPALGPHALYTVSKEHLEFIRKWSEKENLLINFHLSETEKEVKDCLKTKGKRPVEYLEEIGFLSEKLISAHSIWVSDKEIEILAKNKVKIAHNPTSNMKLSSGVLPYQKMKKANLIISLGTDSVASNNNLDMFEEMKFAALLQKSFYKEPTIMPVQEAFELATKNGALALGLNTGEIKEGKLADIILINLKKPELTPHHNLISNLVYSANGSCVSETICNGKILMQNRKVKNEEEILEKAEEVAQEILKR